MKPIVIFFLFCTTSFYAAAQQKKQNTVQVAADSFRIVEASCGQCRFGMKGKGCNLAVRLDGKSYFVDGTKIDDHGDAHADDGFCNRIRQARVSGTVMQDRFVASSFTLLPEPKAKP